MSLSDKEHFLIALESNKENARKAVIFFIHGGANTEGDGSNGYYGPDFIVEDDVVLVTTNYRLGPWGFSNFDLKGYTGNMGLKDQQLALEWVKRNIKHFGGDPSSITVCGESTGELIFPFVFLNCSLKFSISIIQVRCQCICTCYQNDQENV